MKWIYYKIYKMYNMYILYFNGYIYSIVFDVSILRLMALDKNLLKIY